MQSWWLLKPKLALAACLVFSACGGNRSLQQVCASKRSAYIQKYGAPTEEEDSPDSIEMDYLDEFIVTLTESNGQCIATVDG